MNIVYAHTYRAGHKIYNYSVILKSALRMDRKMGGKPGLIQTTKDFSTQTSFKGEVTYIFERKRDLFDWLLWPFVVLGFVTMAIFLFQVICWVFVNSGQTGMPLKLTFKLFYC